MSSTGVGGPITDKFNIGVATLMVGPMDKILELNPEEHSLGLVKNVTMTSETSEVELKYGIRGTTVDSQVTGVDTTISTEVYEYTASNLAYAAQLDGNEFATGGTYALSAAVTGGSSATTVSIVADSDITSKFPKGTKIMLQASSTEEFDKVYLAVVESATFATNKVTITLSEAIPLGWNFSAGDKVQTVNVIPVGSDKPQPYLGVKIVGMLPNGNEPVTIIIPKAKITSGMTLGFTTDDYSNMPFEIKPYALTKSDAMFDYFRGLSSIANAYILTR